MDTAVQSTPLVSVTPQAAKEIKKMIDREGRGNVALRVGVRSGGCSGLSYQLSFDANISPQDRVMEVDGLRVVVDEKSSAYLTGMTLDFSNNLVDGGLKFINPNAKQSCGCGESFSA